MQAPPKAPPRTELSHSWLLAVIAAAYFAAGKAGLLFATVNSSATAIWPASGLALAALLVFGYRMWPAILLGAFFVNATNAGNGFTAMGIACGNTLEAVVGAYLVNQFASGRHAITHPSSIFKFTGYAALFATTLAATIGTTTLVLGHLADWHSFGAVWITWWLGDASGVLVFAPLALLWYNEPRVLWRRERPIEALALLGSILGVSWLVFVGPALNHYPVGFLCLPPLVWAAFRFGSRAGVTSVALIAVIATSATLQGAGPFVSSSPNESLLVVQAFLGTVTLMTMIIAALVRQQRALSVVDRSGREDAEAANRAKDEFLAMLGHELRNPLAAISAAIGILRETPADDDMGAHALNVVNRQTKHLARLVDDLLDISRISTGKLVINRELVELSVVVARAIESTRPLIDARGHKLDLDLAEDPVWADGDVTRLAQVIVNLLNNAAKYTPDRGNIRISLRKEGEEAVIRVRDTGVGIPAALLPKVFEMFTQAEQTLDRSHGGLGIGLTLARRLVALHGGSIHAHSDGVGRGSEFTVRLPLAPVQPFPARVSGGHAMEQLFPKYPARRVLVVDDNVDSAVSMAALLRLRGNDVRIAHDGPSAVDVARDYRPELALLDIGLPGMNGYELARRLRELTGNGAIVLVAVTGYGAEEDRRLSKQAGFDEHLVKPVPFDAVEKLLTALPPIPSVVS